jgi:3-hydroxyisobutyrate dehydrogenase
MGKALAESLISADHEVAVWDRHTDRVATTAMLGASPTYAPNQFAELTDVIFLALPNPTAVREVLFNEEHGLLLGLKEGAVIVDMTTGDRGLAKEVADRVAALGKNARYVDAPVSGKAPKLTTIVGGAERSLGIAEEAVNDISTTVVYTGKLGDGFATKLVHQHVKYATHQAVAEALLIAEAAGLDLPTVISTLENSSGVAGGQKSAVEYFTQDKRGIRSHAPSTTIAKDMRLASELAASVGVKSDSLQSTTEFFESAVAGDLAKAPYPESIALLREQRVAAEERAGA